MTCRQRLIADSTADRRRRRPDQGRSETAAGAVIVPAAAREAGAGQGMMRRSRRSVKMPRNIFSVSMYSWKPKRRALEPSANMS